MNRWFWLMVGVTVLWGAAFPITKPALDAMMPATFTALRFLLVCFILTPLAWLVHRRATGRAGLGIDRRDWPRLVGAGFIGYVVTQVSQNWALSLSPSSDIAVIAATQPVWIVILGALFLHERVARAAWVGLGCCLLGVLLITGVVAHGFAGGATGDVSGWRRPVGDAIFLVGSACWAVYNLLNRPLGERNPPMSAVAAMSLIGLAGLLPLALAEQAGWLRLPGITAPTGVPLTGIVVAGVVYNALFVTIVGLLVLLVAYRHLAVAQVAATFYVSPLTGVLVAVAWLGEPLRAGFVLGAPLVFLGLALTTSRAPAAATPPAE